MATWQWNAFEGSHTVSQVKEGLVDSGGRRPAAGHVHESQGKWADLRPCRGGADMVRTLVNHGSGQGRSCANECQGHGFKDD